MASRYKIILLALILTLAQVTLFTAVSGKKTFADSYTQLCLWDCKLYARIADEGYPPTLTSPPPPFSTAGFFPGYPLAVKVVGFLTWSRPETASLVASQIFTFGFWIYFILMCLALGIDWPLLIMSAFLILSYPQAFYMVAGYSEPFFLMNLMGFIYWLKSDKPKDYVAAVFHGFAMSATRLVGLPLVILPLILKVMSYPLTKTRFKKHSGEFLKSLAISFAASLGALSFFIFSQIRYGHWDEYMRAQFSGWQVRADYFFFLKLNKIIPTFPSFDNDWGMTQAMFPYMLLAFAGLFAVEIFIYKKIDKASWKIRFPFYFCSLTMLYISAAGVSSTDMRSFIRYNFSVYIFFILSLTLAIQRIIKKYEVVQDILLPVALCFALLSTGLQGLYASKFTHGMWVAKIQKSLVKVFSGKAS